MRETSALEARYHSICDQVIVAGSARQGVFGAPISHRLLRRARSRSAGRCRCRPSTHWKRRQKRTSCQRPCFGEGLQLIVAVAAPEHVGGDGGGVVDHLGRRAGGEAVVAATALEGLRGRASMPTSPAIAAAVPSSTSSPASPDQPVPVADGLQIVVVAAAPQRVLLALGAHRVIVVAADRRLRSPMRSGRRRRTSP